VTAQVPAAVQAVFEKTRGDLARRVETLEETVAAMREGKLDESLRARAERDAHKLAGSLGMFGFPRGSELARELEQALDVPDGPAPSEAPRLAELVLALRSELDDAPAGPVDVKHADRADDADRPVSDGRALLLVSPDPVLTERLSVEALRRRLRPRSAHSSAAARRLAATEPPDAAVLDLDFSEGNQEGLELLVDLAGYEPPVPVVVLTGSEDLVDRVEVARRGGRGFIQRSQPASEVVDAVGETIERRGRVAAKLLAVDDDPAISEALAALLAPIGLEVTTLNDPRRFWERLEAIKPDLLVLDLDMPDLDGIDLCRAVRADVRFGRLPVLFLTARSDAGSVQRIFEAGADDYVSKPIVGPELVTRIQNRLERVHLLRELAERDSLTGVASRRRSTAALEDLIALADRFGQPLSVALIDLDNFKKLNDRLGHAAGDAALRRIGAMLTAAFRGEDVIGRWGGEEFVVGTYGMVRDDGIQRVAEVLESFRTEQFNGRDGRSARVSFSAGVAEFPLDGRDLTDLYRAADEALYRAKAEGRNRVFPAGSPRSASQHPDVVVVEDDSALASLLVESLETRGHRTRWLDDGQEAVAALAGASPDISPDLILLDVDLPGLDGLSVLRRLAHDDVLSDTRVIMLTARAGEAEVLEALELGAFDHVAKPFSVPVLMQRVRRALRR
jgi:diguanylate cyclase (GGDEF)-like protein